MTEEHSQSWIKHIQKRQAFVHVSAPEVSIKVQLSRAMQDNLSLDQGGISRRRRRSRTARASHSEEERMFLIGFFSDFQFLD